MSPSDMTARLRAVAAAAAGAAQPAAPVAMPAPPPQAEPQPDVFEAEPVAPEEPAATETEWVEDTTPPVELAAPAVVTEPAQAPRADNDAASFNEKMMAERAAAAVHLAEARKHWRISDDDMEALIKKYTRDLTGRYRSGKTDPVIGRDNELDQIITIIIQRGRSNALLIGPAGVGKTAAFAGAAQLIASEQVPPMLIGARVLELDMAMIGSGATSRSDYESRLVPLLTGSAERNETKGNPPIIYCIDEIHMLMFGFEGSSAAGVSDLLKPYLTVGNLQVIGATTRNEYNDFVTKDAAFDRRFQKVYLNEPSLPETRQILKGLKHKYEQHFNLRISEELCDKIVDLTDKFLRKRNHPDKDILALDAACARAVKKGLWGTDLDNESVVMTIAIEAGLHRNAIE